jgi:PAS domain-containing protein
MAVLYISILGLQVAARAGGIPMAYDAGTSTHMLASLLMESALVCYYAKVMENEEKVVVAHNAKLRETSQIIQNEMSQRKKAEDELLRISQAVRSSSDAIAIEDIDGTHLYHNKAFYNLFNYSISGLNAYGGVANLFNDPVPGKVHPGSGENRRFLDRGGGGQEEGCWHCPNLPENKCHQ